MFKKDDSDGAGFGEGVHFAQNSIIANQGSSIVI